MGKKDFVLALACGSLSARQSICGVMSHYILAGRTMVDLHRDMCAMASAKAADQVEVRLRSAVQILEQEDNDRK